MLLVLSPAKTLDFSPAAPDIAATEPQALKDTAALAAITRKLKRADLKRLMGVSDKLADLNVARFQVLDVKAHETKAHETSVQAALAFAGDVYDGLDARTFSPQALDWAQDRLRILSGLYGVLRPLDRIQPYRLEMGVKLANRRGATLYDFWGDRIAKALNAAAKTHADPTLVNLASQEYFAAVDRKTLKLPVVSCAFKQARGGELRNLALYAKTARGLMARYAVDHRIEQAQALKGFDFAGYGFRADLSDAMTWVFVRDQPQPKG